MVQLLIDKWRLAPRANRWPPWAMSTMPARAAGRDGVSVKSADRAARSCGRRISSTTITRAPERSLRSAVHDTRADDTERARAHEKHRDPRR
ncbi:MAG TPA: hypothetical protein VK932_28835 [Kofleriaceae bacterium]|nr:hypothetical protein [Kofleriaceae bacterium]